MIYIFNQCIPGEVQNIIETKNGMEVMVNLDQHMKYKVANAIGDAANNLGSAEDGMSTCSRLAMSKILA
jgi:membrane protease subunit (stomatin/prohibitin family)